MGGAAGAQNQGGAGAGAGGNGPGGMAPAGEWINSTANLAGLDSECGNLPGLFSKPDEDMLIAGVSLQGLWSSRDGGSSWDRMGTGAGSDTIINRPLALVFDPEHPEIFYEAGLYNGGGVYKTTDDGVTFKQLDDITHSDLVSVDFTDPDRKTLLAGGHESSQTLRKSTDAGATWTDIGAGLPSGAECTSPLVIDAQTYLVGCTRGTSGIVRSTDGGATWSFVSTPAGGAREPLRASDGTIYWASYDIASLARSSDDGATWEELPGSGGGVYAIRPVELPDGRIVTLSKDNVIISADKGETWTLASAQLPVSDPFGVIYSVAHKAFFIWHWSCGSNTIPVPGDAIMQFPFDYETQ